MRTKASPPSILQMELRSVELAVKLLIHYTILSPNRIAMVVAMKPGGIA